MAGSFETALDTLQSLVQAASPDGGALSDAFEAVQKTRPAALRKADVETLFAVCLPVLGLGAKPIAADLDERSAWVLPFQAKRLIEETFFDHGNRNRSYVANTIYRSLALGREIPEGAPKKPVPLVHVALDQAQAAALAAPYLAHLEQQMATAPYGHLKLCWEVMENPIAPFDRVFADWLDHLDQQSIAGGQNRRALTQAFASYQMVEEGRQRLSWSELRSDVMAQLNDPHPLVVAHAARFIGVLMSEPEYHMLDRGTPMGMAEMLHHLRCLPAHRRAAAGGFLNGVDAFDGGPLTELRKHPELSDFDVEDWVFEVLDLGEDEPYLPGAQAFWFYLHEEYDRSPAVVDRLIDAGHIWIAMMCATEIQAEVPEMCDVLQRLSGVADNDIAARATHWFRQFHSSADGASDSI